MKTLSIMLAATALALPLSAGAAEDKRAEGMQQQTSAEMATAVTDLSQDEMRKLIGKSIQTNAGNKLGEITDVVTRDGKAAQVVVRVGGELEMIGAEDDRIMIDADTLTRAPTEENMLVTSTTMSQLEAAPKFLRDEGTSAQKAATGADAAKDKAD